MKQYINSAIIALAVIIGFFIVGAAYKYKFKATENITVTGLAEKDFASDQIVWTGNYSRKMMDLKRAYSLLKEDEGKIRTYLKTKGVAEGEMVFSAVAIDKDFTPKYELPICGKVTFNFYSPFKHIFKGFNSGVKTGFPSMLINFKKKKWKAF